ncbi:IS256 family transposase [Microaceticoccus formicicus]|uniref:IS256 family transposase n=1 Tax=Microaceticoccus formicicus TaxID=3118105 RepID=UPI003CD0489A|nr:IS256 family transposase [Peptoniphilaceae bacterium AMB_02]
MVWLYFTLDSEIIKGLFSASAKENAIAKLLESILNQVLEAQVTEAIGAKPYERTEERTCYRNGSRVRQIKTRVGTLELLVPRVRGGEFSPDLFNRYQRNEQAFVLAMMEMVIQGVSTRKVTKITEELCGTSFSKSTISNLCSNLDPLVDEFRNRPLESQYPFIVVDAMYLKSRDAGKVRSKALMIAIGVRSDGIREILGFMCGDSETELGWRNFFSSLKDRGLSNVDIVVSDSHKGLKSAILKEFQGSSWQRCQTHFSRNILDVCPTRLQPEIKNRLRELYDAPTTEVARTVLNDILDEYSNTAPKAMELLDAGFDDITQVLNIPIKYRKRLRTSNIIERLNQEIRRRERVIRIFPNDESMNRLIGAILIDLDEKWSSGRIWLDMHEYHESKQDQAELQQVEPTKVVA